MGIKAKHLKVFVKKNGEEKANLTFPIYTLRHIDTLMPRIIIDKLKSRGIDLNQLVVAVREGGETPQVLFELVDEDNYYKVWID